MFYCPVCQGILAYWHKGVSLYEFNGHNKSDLLLRLELVLAAHAEEDELWKLYNRPVKRNSARKQEDTLCCSHQICSLFPLGSNRMNWRSPQLKTLNPIHSSFATFQNPPFLTEDVTEHGLTPVAFLAPLLLIIATFNHHLKTNNVPLAWS